MYLRSAQETIIAALRTKQSEAKARSYLRTRKQLEDVHAKRVGALETVNELLLKIEQAVGDAEIMRTYETSAHTIRRILADPVLQPERVDKTMDELAESVARQDEVQSAIAPSLDEDDVAAEMEWLTLEAQAEEKETAQGRPTESTAPVQLPDAPTHAPDKEGSERLPQNAEKLERASRNMATSERIPEDRKPIVNS